MRVRRGPRGGSTGTGTTWTGISTSAATLVADVVARDPELVEEPGSGAVLVAEDVRLPEPDSDRVPPLEEGAPHLGAEPREVVRAEADEVRVVEGLVAEDEPVRMALATERLAVWDRGNRDAARVERAREPARDLAQTRLDLEEADDVDALSSGRARARSRALGSTVRAVLTRGPTRALGSRRAPRCGRSRSSPGEATRSAGPRARSRDARDGAWPTGPRVPAAKAASPQPHGQVDVLVAPPDEAPVEPVHRLEVGTGDAGAEAVGVAMRSEVRELRPPGPAAVARREVAQAVDVASPPSDERWPCSSSRSARGHAAPHATVRSPSCRRSPPGTSPGSQPRRIAATKWRRGMQSPSMKTR